MRVFGVAVAAEGVVVAGCGGGSQEAADAGIPGRCAGPSADTWHTEGGFQTITLAEDCSFLQVFAGYPSQSVPGCRSQVTYAAALPAHGSVAMEIGLYAGPTCGISGTNVCGCLQVGAYTCAFDRDTTDTLTLNCGSSSGSFYGVLHRSP